jgi:hypothetical protein
VIGDHIDDAADNHPLFRKRFAMICSTNARALWASSLLNTQSFICPCEQSDQQKPRSLSVCG